AVQPSATRPAAQTRPSTAALLPASQPAGPPDLEAGGLDDLQLLGLEVPTVVSATRREQRIASLPYAVSVITHEDIRAAGARSVPDALRLVPGVDVAETSYGLYAVSPRGLHSVLSRGLLVLVDGRQIFDTYFGGTVWQAWPIQLEDIERIEVIRGPGGVTWGSNAVNGFINIVTKDPATQTGLTAVGNGGTRGTNTEHLGYAFRDGKLALRVSGEHESSDGFRKGGSLLAPLDDSFRAGRGNVHAVYEATPNDKWTFSLGSALVENGYPAGPFTILDATQAGSQANYGLVNWQHRLAADNTLQLTAYVNDFQVSTPYPAVDYRYQQLALLFSHTFKPADGHTFTWGIDNRTDLFDATNADPFMLSKRYVSTHMVGLYAQDEWRFAPKWTLSLGGRVDYEFYSGVQPSARAALAYDLAEHSTLYAAVSRAFNLPEPAGRFTYAPLFGSLVGTRSDDTLDAETMLAYEVGYRGHFFDRLETNLNLFWNEYYDVTTFHPGLGGPGLINMVFDNGASPAIYGLEWDARYRVTSRLTLLGNYTFEVLDWEGAQPITSTDMMAPPRHKFMVAGRYQVTDDLNLSAHLYYVDAALSPDSSSLLGFRRVDPYFRLDLRAEHEFWQDKASLAVGVRNLLDPDHFEGSSKFFNSAEVPRMVYAELRIRLDG
ncbi:MAG: TonB-dependent receptor, partial [Phycisphaerae bacterium]